MSHTPLSPRGRSRRGGLATVITAALLLAASACGAADGPAPARPAARSFRFGDLEMTSLVGGAWFVDNDAKVFGVGASPAVVAKVLASAGAPTDRITLDVDALLARMPGHLVLLDTGLPPASHGQLLASLVLAGVAPATVTDILITHGDDDHIGGVLDAAGHPAFPAAVIHISVKEWALLKSEPSEAALVAAIAPQVRAFEPGQPVLPGITPIALYGHTPGHVGYEIVSGSQRMEDIGDIAHSSIVSLARPDWINGFDQDSAAGRATRQRELARLAAAHELVFAPHFPFPGVGWIVPAGPGFVWKPDPDAAR